MTAKNPRRLRSVILVVVWFGVVFICAFPFLRPLIQADLAEHHLSFHRGDLNASGAIDEADMAAAHAWFAGEEPLACIEALDIINDGSLDSADLYALQDLVGGGAMFPLASIHFSRGDLDDNGRIDNRDARILTAFMRGQTALDVPLDTADVNGDGFLDENDSRTLAHEIQLHEHEVVKDGPSHRQFGATIPDVLILNGQVYVAEGAPLVATPPDRGARQPLPPRILIDDRSTMLRSPGVLAPAAAADTGRLMPAVDPDPVPQRVVDGFEYVLDSTGQDYPHDGKGIKFEPTPLPTRIVVGGRVYLQDPGDRGVPPTRVIDGQEYNPDSGGPWDTKPPVRTVPSKELPPRILICGNVYALRSPGIQVPGGGGKSPPRPDPRSK